MPAHSILFSKSTKGAARPPAACVSRPTRSPPYSPDLSPCNYAIFGPLTKALRGKRFTSDDVKQYVRNYFTMHPGNFTRQPFTALCRSGTTTRANTSDKQVLVSVPTPPATFFFNAPRMYTNIYTGCKRYRLPKKYG